jgi:mono/diheme cytochrome c family protein
MNEQEKEKYLASYYEAKKKGEPFFPDVLFKDAIVSLVVFGALIALAYFVGAPLEARANPADTNYTPRPEWYFLFLFQLLKYFPGNLEVIGVVVLPSIVILLLFALPLLDRSNRRHFLHRPVVTGATALAMAGIIALTVLSIREAPPPSATTTGDQTAALYAENCAVCHGPSVDVPPGTNLHEIIAQGKHEGMPAWNADLTSNQIDALAGFIVSPDGSALFTENCSACHAVSELVASHPLDLKQALEEGPDFPAHQDVEVPQWTEVLQPAERTALLNFLVAPDGQRLFAINCASCHGQSVSFSGSEEELRRIISQGGLHLEMPPWREQLDASQLDTLASYVVEPASAPGGEELFGQYCSTCHGERVPKADNVQQAREIIAGGGAHQTMPVWGDILTEAQLDALVRYTADAAGGTSVELGQKLFGQNCSPCHGDFGEGGPNPARSGDIIAPISSAEYLQTRDDATLRAVIEQGQPNFGMSPFGTAFGGPLDGGEVDAIVAYMRSWENNPPVEVPPEIVSGPVSLKGAEIYADLCAQCHGKDGEGGIGPALRDPQFQAENTDQDIFDTINMGHEATAMIAWGEILTSEQIQELVKFIRQLRVEESELPTATPQPAEETPVATPETETETPVATSEVETATPTETPEAATATPTAAGGAVPSFSADVMPIFEARCVMCHGALGGWDASSYDSVMNTGDNAPVVIPGDSEGSLLGQKLLGTQTEGNIMPPSGKLPAEELQIILDWIDGGAPDN